MAKKRKTTKRRGGRRIGAAKSGFDFMEPLMAIAGGAAGGFMNKVVPATVNPKLVSGGKIALGAVLPMLSKDQKTKAMLKAAGHGLIGVGTVELLNQMGMLSGYQAPSDEGFDLAVEVPRSRISDDVLNGDDDLNVINDDVLNGNDDLNVINDSEMLLLED